MSVARTSYTADHLSCVHEGGSCGVEDEDMHEMSRSQQALGTDPRAAPGLAPGGCRGRCCRERRRSGGSRV
jgi:hypothetical protein